MKYYQLIYWPNSGDLHGGWNNNQATIRDLRKVMFFERATDWEASQFALSFGMRKNSDGVLLLRSDGNDVWTSCYKARPSMPDTPTAMQAGDLGLVA